MARDDDVLINTTTQLVSQTTVSQTLYMLDGTVVQQSFPWLPTKIPPPQTESAAQP
jgi:hypothetical protein